MGEGFPDRSLRQRRKPVLFFSGETLKGYRQELEAYPRGCGYCCSFFSREAAKGHSLGLLAHALIHIFPFFSFLGSQLFFWKTLCFKGLD